MMRSTLGALRWSPQEFWSSTPYDLFAAVDGFNIARGGRDPDAWSEWKEREFGGA